MVNNVVSKKEYMMKMNNRSASAGFTLIEIIAVLLILAVLAAVAIPKYLSLVQDAKTRALDGALSAGYSQLSLTFAQKALVDGTAPSAATLITAVPSPAGSFTFTFVAAGTSNITVTAKDVDNNTKSGTWTMP